MNGSLGQVKPMKCYISTKARILEVIDHFSASTSRPYFVQIGSCDGILGDPLYPFIRRDRWRGIAVEPVDYLYERLVENHKLNSGVVCENLAISDCDGKREFWRVIPGQGDLPDWSEHLGSFFPEIVLGHRSKIPNLDSFVVKTTVRCLRLSALLEKHNVTAIDIFHTDAEGYDDEIIRQLDLERFYPRLILFESNHLSRTSLANCVRRLALRNYCFVWEHDNILAYR